MTAELLRAILRNYPPAEHPNVYALVDEICALRTELDTIMARVAELETPIKDNWK